MDFISAIFVVEFNLNVTKMNLVEFVGLTSLIGIVSSNATDTISTLLKKFDISVEFISTSSIFGKAKTLNAISFKRHLDRAEVIYIGDEIRDVEACQKGNIDMLAVTWGFSSKDALQKTNTPTIDHPLEILEIFQGVTKV